MNIIEYAAFEAVNVIGNKIMLCIPEKFNSKYDETTFVSYMAQLHEFIPEEMVVSSYKNTKTIKLKNGSSIILATCENDVMGNTVSELIFTHKKEDYSPSYIFKTLAAIEDKKHRRIIGI